MVITNKVRNYDNYVLDKVGNLAKTTQDETIRILKRFDSFCVSKYNKSRDQIINEVKKLEEEERDDEIITIVQDWVNELSRKGNVGQKAIRVYVSITNKYLKYRRIRIEFNSEIEWPQKYEEERYAVTINEIQQILKIAKWKKQGYYLSLISSGARPIEIVCLKKKDYLWTGTRYKAIIPAKFTKKRMARTVFFSKEVTPYVSKLLKNINEDNYVWTNSNDPHSSRRIESNLLAKYCSKLGLDKKYESTGFNKINLYCFRAYFFTKALRVLDNDTAHALIGHGAYLQQYQRRNDLEKEELYQELEPEILIYDQTKNEEKIRKLKEANTKLSDQAEELKEQAKRIKNLERVWMDSNYPNVNRKSQV